MSRRSPGGRSAQLPRREGLRLLGDAAVPIPEDRRLRGLEESRWELNARWAVLCWPLAAVP